MQAIIVGVLFCLSSFDLAQATVIKNDDVDSKSGQDFYQLKLTAFDQKKLLEIRWRAVTTLGRAYAYKSKGLLEKAMLSREWFMRNAALVVLPYNDRDWARSWAEKLLSDPALVVRTAAVQVLRQLHATESRMLLWQKLSDRENFHRGQPLWIRRHIIETLEQFSNIEDEDRFKLAKEDLDVEVKSVAERAFNKIESLKTALNQESLDSKLRFMDRSKTISR